MSGSQGQWVSRHRLPVRLAHWLNVACLFVLLLSGLQIFNAHPALYWGDIARFDQPALALQARPGAGGMLRGVTVIGTQQFDTTGVLGVSRNLAGKTVARGFPSWATIPGAKDLAQGRRWHFFFAWVFVANGMLYLLWSWRSGHLARDLAPTGTELRGIGASVREHLHFRHPTGEAATRYNVLQKLAYLGVIVVVLPGIVLMGLAMSPTLDSVLGWLVDFVGGRQSARTWHFVFAALLVAFVAVHVVMVIVSGPVNQVRAMITGRYRIPPDRIPPDPAPTPEAAP
jgi:thiosulfate reductase cytochrome b subunit